MRTQGAGKRGATVKCAVQEGILPQLEFYFKVEVNFALFDFEANQYADPYVKPIRSYVAQSNNQFTLSFLSKTIWRRAAVGIF